MLLEALNTARDLGRLHEIGSVLIRHGLGDIVRRLGMARVLERAGRALHWRQIVGLDRPPQVRLREALEELGPTYVKVGQLLAGRADLLPPEWTNELSRLHERTHPVAIDAIRAQLVEDLGAEPEEVFRDFEATPLASASIAQVHGATLPDGRRVVLKIRRPGIRDTVEADLRLLGRLAEKAEERMPELRRFRPRSLVRQLARSLRDELDLRIETKNAERLRGNLPEGSSIVIPDICSSFTRERLCVMERFDGPSLGEWMRNAGRDGDRGAERARIAEIGADAVLRMVFLDGCFHADPHPGNVMLLPDARLGLVDFGMVGYLSDARRREFLGLLMAIVGHDVDRVVDTLLGWSEGEVDLDLLTQDSAAFIDRYYGLPLKELDVSEMLGDLTRFLRENDLFLPNDLALLLKVFVTLDGLGCLLDPDFVMAVHIEPFARQAWRQQNSPGQVVRRGARELGAVMTSFPGDLRRLLYRLRRGRVRIDVDVERLERFGERVARSANRLTVGLVTAALIIGTSISLTVSGGPRIFELPAFGLLGFTSSLVAGVWLLWSILRSGHSR